MIKLEPSLPQIAVYRDVPDVKPTKTYLGLIRQDEGGDPFTFAASPSIDFHGFEAQELREIADALDAANRGMI